MHLLLNSPEKKAFMKHYYVLICLLFSSSCIYGMEKEESASPTLHYTLLADYNTALLHVQDTDTAQKLINDGACIHTRDGQLNTPLHHAAASGNRTLVAFLLQLQANPHLRNIMQETPLMVATWHAHADTAHELIIHGSRLDTKCAGNNTLLHYAARYNNRDLALCITKAMQNKDIISSFINRQNNDKDTPLHLATACNFLWMIQFLTQNHAELDIQNHNGWTPLHTAVATPSNDNYQIVKYLLVSGANPDAQNYQHMTPLCMAIKNRLLQCTETLISHGANVNHQYDTCTPLCLAIEYFNTIALTLLEHGANPDASQAIVLATQHNNLAMVQMLIGWEATHHDLLHYAINANAHDTFNWYIKNYSNTINIKSELFQEYPLGTALKKGNLETIRLLLNTGARLDTVNDFVHILGNYYQEQQLIINIYNLLKEYEIDLTHTTAPYSKKTLLHIAAEKNFAQLAQLLLANGVSIETTDAQGNQPQNYIQPYNQNAATMTNLVPWPTAWEIIKQFLKSLKGGN